MKRFLKVSCLSLGMLSGVQAYAQQSVQWDAIGAIIAGSGCQKDVDAFASANGNDLAIVFTRLGVDLPGGGSAVLADRKNCSIRVPATIAPGIYIGQLTQRLSYGVTKTSGSTVSLATRSSFFSFPVPIHSVNLPYGSSVNQPLLSTARVDNFSVQTAPSWYSGWCSPNRAPRGMYQANIAVAGQKTNSSEDLIAFVDGLDLKYEVVASLVRCQL